MAPRLDTEPDTAVPAGWVDELVLPPLTRPRIVREALALVDQYGLRRLTLDRLGGHLGVAPAALRHHVTGRAELVDLLVDHVDGLALGDAEPDDDAGALLDRYHRRWEGHRPLIAAHWRGVIPGPAGEAFADRVASALRSSGTHPADAPATARALLLGVLASVFAPPDGPA